jgi:hypothetical protein
MRLKNGEREADRKRDDFGDSGGTAVVERDQDHDQREDDDERDGHNQKQGGEHGGHGSEYSRRPKR